MDAETARWILTLTGVATSGAILWCALMLTNIRDWLKKRK